MSKFKLLCIITILCFYNNSLNAQDVTINYNDTLTKKLFEIRKDYSKRIFESTFYTIQIYYGGYVEFKLSNMFSK